MNDTELLKRITANPKVLVGKPVIKGTRLSVELILNLLAHEATPAEIMSEYPGVTPEDIRACLLYASRSLESAEFTPLFAETA
jgi:uncharacterized protein (DUF433 family)